jgi:nicotinamidase-related amidase
VTPNALVVVDLQNGLFGDPAVHDASGLLERAGAAIDTARTRSVPVVYVQDEHGPGLWEPETPGWQIHPGVEPRSGELRIRKLFGDAFRGTNLTVRCSASASSTSCCSAA